MFVVLLASVTAHAAPDVDTPLRTGQTRENEAAVVIGIEDYVFLPDVPYAQRDSQSIFDFLVYTRGIPAHHVQLLQRAPVRETMLNAVRKASEDAGKDGLVWFYFAGHGAAGDSGRVLLGADTQAESSVFYSRSIAVAELQEAAVATGSRAAFIIDACFTGNGRSGEALVPGRRFVVPDYVGASSPLVLEWTAAAQSESSGPLPQARHGAFTFGVLAALRGWADGQLDGKSDGQVTAAEADLYVRDVLKRVRVRDQSPSLNALAPASWVLSQGDLESEPSDGFFASLAQSQATPQLQVAPRVQPHNDSWPDPLYSSEHGSYYGGQQEGILPLDVAALDQAQNVKAIHQQWCRVYSETHSSGFICWDSADLATFRTLNNFNLQDWAHAVAKHWPQYELGEATTVRVGDLELKGIWLKQNPHQVGAGPILLLHLPSAREAFVWNPARSRSEAEAMREFRRIAAKFLEHRAWE